MEPGNLGEGGMSRLQEEVEAALRDQVEARVTSDMMREEVSQVTLEAWATFYSHTLQYHQVGTDVFPIFLSSRTIFNLFIT